MDTVKWSHSTGMETDDVIISDNLLDFVKGEDIVSGLDTQDDILQQGNIYFRCFFLNNCFSRLALISSVLFV